jgi:hypothetical protein
VIYAYNKMPRQYQLVQAMMNIARECVMKYAIVRCFLTGRSQYPCGLHPVLKVLYNDIKLLGK